MAKKKNRTLHPDEPLLHPDHPRPVTRRDFLRQGFISGTGAVIAPSMLAMLVSSAPAEAHLSEDLDLLKAACGIQAGAGKIPFICFDLAGGANFAGSNVLVGGQGGIEDPLTASGYSKLGIAGDRLPSFGGADTNVDRTLGLPFHSQSAMLAGIKARFINANGGGINGAVIPARSANDTGNNPHNPMYGISMAGARGALLTLIGSRNSDSGGNSMSPSYMIDLKKRPTKIDRPRDTAGLIDTGELVKKMGKHNASRVMEAIQRISAAKMSKVSTTNPSKTANVDDVALKKQVNCGYVKSAYDIDLFGDPKATNSNPLSGTEPDGDEFIASIFSPADMNNPEFAKTAAVMKLVINGLAGAGTITMGGYDYHTGDRTTGDARDLRAGQCIGACLEYASLLNKRLMIYVFSDGSVASNGTPDPAAGGKLVWTGDNSSTACSFFLVYNPGSSPILLGGTPDQQMQHQQLGWFRPDASVETNNSTAMANDVNSLAETVILNYMALHGEEGQFENIFPKHSLGSSIKRDSYTAFGKIT